MATKRKDPLDEFLEQTSLESMGFVEETEEQRFARPKPPKTEPCSECGHPRLEGQPTCGKRECLYKHFRLKMRAPFPTSVDDNRILPRVDDIVCEAEVIVERKGR